MAKFRKLLGERGALQHQGGSEGGEGGDTATFGLTKLSDDGDDGAEGNTIAMHATESAGSLAESAAANAAATAVARGSPTAAERRAAKERARAHQQLLTPLSGDVMARVLDSRGMQDVDMIRQKRFQKRLTPNLYRFHPEAPDETGRMLLAQLDRHKYTSRMRDRERTG